MRWTGWQLPRIVFAMLAPLLHKLCLPIQEPLSSCLIVTAVFWYFRQFTCNSIFAIATGCGIRKFCSFCRALTCFGFGGSVCALLLACGRAFWCQHLPEQGTHELCRMMCCGTTNSTQRSPIAALEYEATAAPPTSVEGGLANLLCSFLARNGACSSKGTFVSSKTNLSNPVRTTSAHCG